MKRLILVLVTAALVAMVPAATAGSAPVTASAAPATVNVINTCLGAAPGCAPGTPPAIDVWSGTTRIITDLAFGSSITVTVDAGTANYVVCAEHSTNNTCAGSVLLFPSTPRNYVGGTNNTTVIGAGAVTNFTNDISPTAFGNARFTFHNADTVTLYVCANGEPLFTSTANPNGGTAVGSTNETEFAQAVPGSLIVSPAPNLSCAGTANPIPGFAAGTNFVLTATNDPGCTSGCVNIITVGQERPANSPDLATFCPALLGLQAIQAEFKSVFGGINVEDPGTFPSDEAVKAFVNDINAKLQAGDAQVAATVLPQWETVTSGLRTLAAGLTSAGFQLSNIPAAALQKIVDGANGVNQAPNPAQDAATAVLTKFFTSNCVAASAAAAVVTPKFTG